MTLEELLKKLKKAGVDEDIIDGLQEVFDSEVEKSKDAKRKNDKENISLRKRMKEYQEALKGLDIDVDGDIKEQLEELKTKDSNKSESLTKTEKMLEALNKRLDEKDKAEQSLRKKLHNKTISSEIRKALKAGNTKVLDGIEDLIVDKYINSGRGKVDENDKVVFEGEDGLPISISDEIESCIKKNPGWFKIDQNPGGGSTNSKSKNTNTISKSEWESMSGKQKAAYAAENADFEIT